MRGIELWDAIFPASIAITEHVTEKAVEAMERLRNDPLTAEDIADVINRTLQAFQRACETWRLTAAAPATWNGLPRGPQAVNESVHSILSTTGPDGRVFDKLTAGLRAALTGVLSGQEGTPADNLRDDVAAAARGGSDFGGSGWICTYINGGMHWYNPDTGEVGGPCVGA